MLERVYSLRLGFGSTIFDPSFPLCSSHINNIWSSTRYYPICTVQGREGHSERGMSYSSLPWHNIYLLGLWRRRSQQYCRYFLVMHGTKKVHTWSLIVPGITLVKEFKYNFRVSCCNKTKEGNEDLLQLELTYFTAMRESSSIPRPF